jgi:hypothetical protein
MLTPKISITCPICGIELACQVRDINPTDASWAFTAKSFEHLKSASCIKSNSPVFLGEDRSTCKEAA